MLYHLCELDDLEKKNSKCRFFISWLSNSLSILTLGTIIKHILIVLVSHWTFYESTYIIIKHISIVQIQH